MTANKAGGLPWGKVKQLQHESDTWKRELCFMGDENIHLKNRLSEIVKGDIDKNLLENAETFQIRLIAEDEQIRGLRRDIAAFAKLVVREVFEDGVMLNEIMQKLGKIRVNMSSVEKQFNKLKIDFNRYFLENTSTN